MEQEGKEALVHFLRRYTVIDFLGYLIPGAIVTLVWNQRFNGMLKAPFTDFFGEQAVLLGLYFLVLSYLVGTVIHELSTCAARNIEGTGRCGQRTERISCHT